MKIVELNEIEFDVLAKCEPNASFYQTSYWAKYYAYQGYEPLYLGYLSDKNVYLAFAMILVSKGSLFQGKQALCPAGFLINYYDTKLLTQFTKDLKKYLRKKHVSSLYIEPNIEYHTSRINNDLLISNLKKLGYQKIKNCKYFTAKVKKPEKTIIAKELCFNSYCVLDDNDKLFNNDSKCKYLHDSMKEHAKFIVCELDSEKSISNLEKTINDINEYLDSHQYDINIDKTNIKKKQLLEKQRLLELVNYCVLKKGNNPILMTTCLIEYDNKIAQIFVDNDRDYKEFKAFDVANETILRTINDLGYKTYTTCVQTNNAIRTELVGGFELTL